MIHTEKHVLLTEGGFQAFNVTEKARSAVKTAGIRHGSVLIYYTHTTGAVIVVEHEAGIIVDLEDALNKIASPEGEYKHHLRGFDFNGFAHIGTSLLGVSVTVPVLDGDLLLGTYQEILVIDMEPRARQRTLVIQVSGE